MNGFKHILIIALAMLSVFISSNAKSLPKAMLMSAVLPGSGEIYAGSLTRGVLLLTADTVLLFSALTLDSDVKRLDNSFKQFAFAKAGIPLNQSNDYYELLHKWYSSEEYNKEIELYFRNLGMVRFNNPNYYNDAIIQYSIANEESWQWNNLRDWNKYKDIRRTRNKQMINKNLVIGAAIANRVISVLSTVFLIRKQNRLEKMSLNLTPDLKNSGVILSCSWEF